MDRIHSPDTGCDSVKQGEIQQMPAATNRWWRNPRGWPMDDPDLREADAVSGHMTSREWRPPARSPGDSVARNHERRGQAGSRSVPYEVAPSFVRGLIDVIHGDAFRRVDVAGIQEFFHAVIPTKLVPAKAGSGNPLSILQASPIALRMMEAESRHGIG